MNLTEVKTILHNKPYCILGKQINIEVWVDRFGITLPGQSDWHWIWFQDYSIFGNQFFRVMRRERAVSWNETLQCYMWYISLKRFEKQPETVSQLCWEENNILSVMQWNHQGTERDVVLKRKWDKDRDNDHQITVCAPVLMKRVSLC